MRLRLQRQSRRAKTLADLKKLERRLSFSPEAPMETAKAPLILDNSASVAGHITEGSVVDGHL